MFNSGFCWIGPIALASLSAVGYDRQAGQDLRVPQPLLPAEYDPDALVKIIEKLLAQ